MFFSKAREGFEFYQRLRNHSAGTLQWYSERLGGLKNFLRQKSPQPLINEITRQDLEEFVAFLQSRETIGGTDRYHKPQNRKLSQFTDTCGLSRPHASRWAAKP